ncbi:hypothetical protein CWB60_07140 [Pseudoalteromonas sp. S327]|uniref:hypothetical protein n=1 Tax=unclassified Pseudoalteromonas TaxID=194690 RepID=UPI00110AC4BA|nr:MULTISPECIES: hypothetical protein [unclassified Pseudoalteromonas]TMO07814.1 hypothetical protein CWB60_07140 [Pseudoalteromonas sp. S327]TMO15499.1 hypothetical protein CWB59_15335 [Pseudoalteromonas sp. S326]
MEIKRWEVFKSFFQITILKYLVMWFSLVPVVAGIVTQLPDPLPVNIAGTTHDISLTLPFYWQVLWLSSLSFVGALGLYKTFCPDFIHKYNKYADYTSYQHDPRWLVWEAHTLFKFIDQEQRNKLLKRLKTKNYLTISKEKLAGNQEFSTPSVCENQTIMKIKYDGETYDFGMPIRDHAEDTEKSIFYEFFGRYSASRGGVRKVIQILLIISLILFLFVLLQHIYHGAVFICSWVNSFIC